MLRLVPGAKHQLDIRYLGKGDHYRYVHAPSNEGRIRVDFEVAPIKHTPDSVPHPVDKKASNW